MKRVYTLRAEPRGYILRVERVVLMKREYTFRALTEHLTSRVLQFSQ